MDSDRAGLIAGLSASKRRLRRPLLGSAVLALLACSVTSSVTRPGSTLAAAQSVPNSEQLPPVSEEEGIPWNMVCTGVLIAVMLACYGSSWRTAKALQTKEASQGEVAPAGAGGKKPRIDAFDSLRFFLIAYIASGHFIHTATRNPFLLRLITQINVVVGAFFVLSGYVAAYTTTELGERKGSKRLDNAVEFAVSRIMGFWPLHLLVLVLFSPMFFWVDAKFSGGLVAAWQGFISAALLQAWFPASAEVWNAPTWFLSAFAFCLCVLPYALRVLALQKKAELRRTLVVLTLLSLLPKLGYTYDLKAWDTMEGTLNARTHDNYMLFNVLRFSPFSAVLEVLMGAAACRLVMLDAEPGKTGSPLLPLVAMLGIVTLRAAGLMTMNDLLVRTLCFMPLWIAFLMRIHRESVGGSVKLLPKVLCSKALTFLGGISFPIFIVHGPIGQVFYKKAVATELFGGPPNKPSPTGIHWFFSVYWAIVLLSAVLLQKGFVENSRVKAASAAASAAIVKALS